MRTITRQQALEIADDVTALPAARVRDDGHDWYEGESHIPAWEWIHGRDVDLMGRVEISRIEDGKRVWYRVEA